MMARVGFPANHWRLPLDGMKNDSLFARSVDVSSAPPRGLAEG